MGPNLTLQSDIRGFIEDAKKIAELGKNPEFDPLDQQLKLLHLLAGYYNYVHHSFSVTARTQNVFLEAKDGIIGAITENHSELKQILREKSLGVMSDNPHMEKIDEAIDFEDDQLEREVELKIRKVQPACVKIGISDFGQSWAASGVNLRADGLIITNAHVAQKLQQKVNVTFPNGRTEEGTCTAIDRERDLAIIKLDNVIGALPLAALSPTRPEAGTGVVVIGMPSNAHNWYVSTGIVKEYKPDHPWVSPEGAELGGLAHTAWTYWGHSGSPLFDHEGRVIALHNTWNSVTAMRHGIPLDEIQAFLQEND